MASSAGKQCGEETFLSKLQAVYLGRVPETRKQRGDSPKNGGSDALYFMFLVYTEFRQSTQDQEALLKDAGVTPWIPRFWFTQILDRLPETAKQRGNAPKKWRE